MADITSHVDINNETDWLKLVRETLPSDNEVPLSEFPMNVSKRLAEKARRSVEGLLRGRPHAEFYPRVVLSFATGRRPPDCEGPGQLIAAGLLQALSKHECETYSDLYLPPGNNWRQYELRFTDPDKARAQVLVVLLTRAFFCSLNCMEEVALAEEHDCWIIPIRVEEISQRYTEWWPTSIMQQDIQIRFGKNDKRGTNRMEKLRLARSRAVRALNKAWLPANSTLLNDENALSHLVTTIQGILNPRADPMDQSGLTRQRKRKFGALQDAPKESIIDVYCAMQFPSTLLGNLHEGPKIVSELQRIVTRIQKGKTKELQDMRKALSLIHLTDARKSDLEKEFKASAVRVLVWCAEGVDESGENDTFIDLDSLRNAFQSGEPPEVVVVCMAYGASLVAKKIRTLGVKKVISLRVDPYGRNLYTLLLNVVLPFIKEIISDGGKYEESFESLTRNANTVDPCCECSHYTDGSPMPRFPSRSTEEIMPRIEWKTHACCCTTGWFQSKGLRRLKLDFADFPLLEKAKAYVLKQGREDDCGRMFLAPCIHGRERRETWDRARARALYLCNEIAGDGSVIFDDGVYRVASKNDALNLQESLEGTTGRALVWVDFSNEKAIPFDSAETGQYWIDGFGEDATIVLVFTCVASCISVVEDLVAALQFKRDGGDFAAPKGHGITAGSSYGVLTVLPHKNVADGEQRCWLDNIADPNLLCGALTELLLEIDADRHFARDRNFNQIKVYRDDDMTTKICVSVADLEILKRLLDVVYVGKGALKFAKTLSQNHNDGIRFDYSSFATCYEQLILQLDMLTENQYQVLADLRTKRRVHIRGGAGTGKTFLALYSTLEYLRHDGTVAENMLYVCLNAALGFHFARWLCTRLQSEIDENSLLRRVFFLGKGMEKPVGFKNVNGILMDVPVSSDEAPTFGKIVIDEAHDVFGKAHEHTFGENVKTLLKQHTNAEVMLLSDISQASVPEDEISYPDQVTDCFMLTEVCRSTKRIISGSMSFQLSSKDEKEAVSFAHDSNGLELRTYMFSASDNEGDIYQVYAKKVVQVIKDILRKFQGLDLHGRLAVIVPHKEFRKRLCEGERGLVELLNSQKQELGQHIVPKHALEASRALCVGNSRSRRAESWIVVDSVSEMDGLERLLVIGVGLDEMITDEIPGRKLVCSRIYRTMTRAHLAVYLVQERKRGGWLEFIHHIEQKEAPGFSFEETVKVANDAAKNLLNKNARRVSVAPLHSLKGRGSEHGPADVGKASDISEPPGLQHPLGEVELVNSNDVDDGVVVGHETKLRNVGVWDTSANEPDATSSPGAELASLFVPLEDSATKAREAPANIDYSVLKNSMDEASTTPVASQPGPAPFILSMSNLSPEQRKLIQDDLASRERQASALAAAGWVADIVVRTETAMMQTNGHGVSGTLGMTWQGLHAPPALAATAPPTTPPGGMPAEGTNWNMLDTTSTLDDIELDFAKLFDPAHEVANMRTEGSGWPGASGTTNAAVQPISPAPVANGLETSTVPTNGSSS